MAEVGPRVNLLGVLPGGPCRDQLEKEE